MLTITSCLGERKKYHCGGHSWRGGLFTQQLKKWVKAVFLLGCYGCIFHGTGNSSQLCQNFVILGGVWTPQTPPLGTPMLLIISSILTTLFVKGDLVTAGIPTQSDTADITLTKETVMETILMCRRQKSYDNHCQHIHKLRKLRKCWLNYLTTVTQAMAFLTY